MDVADILLNIVLFFPLFLFALTVHEVAHALVANWGGDTTASRQDRLSLNPLVHIDPLGTVLLPLIAIVMPGRFPFFGWAKPVPVDEANFRDKAWNVAVALAGPFSNLLLVVFGLLLLELAHNSYWFGMAEGWWSGSADLLKAFYNFALIYVSLNWTLFLFNLIPIPPLDGSHVLYHFFVRGNGHLYAAWDAFRQFGFIALLLALQFPFMTLPVDFLRDVSFALLAPDMAAKLGILR